MKPKELIEYCGIPHWNWAQAETKECINRYFGEECVIAYDKNKIGVIFIIKGKIKHFGFVSIKEDIYLGGHGYKLRKLELKTILSLLGDDCKILDKKEYSKIKKGLIIEGLK